MSQTDLQAVAEALRANDRLLVVTHENPDGDALGSILGATIALRSLGKDTVMYLGGDAPFPAEFNFLPLDEIRREIPDDIESRVVLTVDCANADRLGPDTAVLERARLVLNVDHHHDNSRFGDVNLVVADASSTAEILRDLLSELDVALTPKVAEALYVGLVTDTGKFQYANTTPKALRLAAELIEAGADAHGIFRRVWESVQFAKVKLLARALESARLFEGGRLLVAFLLRDDFAAAGATEPYSEGIIDYLRQVEGTEMVALVREPPRDGGPAFRASLRSSHDEIDVSAIAQKAGGGGHRQAAGFSSEGTLDEIVDFIHREFVRTVDPRDGADAPAGA